MKTAPRAQKTSSLPSLAAALCTLSAAAIAVAQAPSPSGTAAATGTQTGTQTGTPSGAAQAGSAIVELDTYAWPTEPSAEPTDAEYDAGAQLKIPENRWEKGGIGVARTCVLRVVREWVRVRCDPVSESTSYGVVWGAAGDLSSVKARMPLRGTVNPNKAPPQSFIEESTLKMGAYVTLSFQAKPGSAFLVDIHEMGWEFGGWGDGFLNVSSAVQVELSWAAGEKTPSILLL